MANVSNLTNPTIFGNEFKNNSIHLDYYSPYYDYENPFPKQDLFYLGLVCVTLILSGIPVYALVLYFFLTKEEFTSLLSYRMMVYLGISDMLQMCFYIFYALTMIVDNSFGYWVSAFGNIYYYSIWTQVNLMVLLVAINRFDVFLPIPIAFDRKKAFNILAIIFLLIPLSQFILGLIPGYRIIALAPLGEIMESEKKNPFWIFRKINYAALGGAVILYLIAIVSIIIKRCIFAQTQFITKSEIHMFLQTILPCLLKTAIVVAYDYITPNTFFETSVESLVMFFEAGYQPYIYLLFNKSLQIRIKFLIQRIMKKGQYTTKVTPMYP